MLKPILHSIRNQPTLWLIDGERVRSISDTIFISLLSRGRIRMDRPVEKYLIKLERLALKRAIKYWKKKKIAKAARQVNATQHQR